MNVVIHKQPGSQKTLETLSKKTHDMAEQLKEEITPKDGLHGGVQLQGQVLDIVFLSNNKAVEHSLYCSVLLFTLYNGHITTYKCRYEIGLLSSDFQ